MKTEPKYKVGDKVLVTNACPYSGFFISSGNTVTVIKINRTIKCRLDNGQEWNYNPKWIRPLTKLEKALQ